MASVSTRTWSGADGKSVRGYQVSWYDESGRRHRKLFTGPNARRDANDARLAIEIARRKGQATAADGCLTGGLTVRMAGERWVRYVERELRRERTTWIHYEQELRDHINPIVIRRRNGADVAFGDLDVAEVTAPDCEALKDRLLAKLSQTMAARMMVVARMMFNDVIRRGEIPHNPAATAKVRKIDRGEDEVVIPQEDEIRTLIKAVASEAPRPPSFAEAWIGMTIFSGLRPSENRGAAIEDLTLDGANPGIDVRRRADAWSKLGPVKTGNGRRYVPLPPAAVALLRRWLLVVPRGHGHPDKEGYVDGVPDPENPGQRIHLLFPTSHATVQTLPNIYNRAWLPAMVKAGLVDWVPFVGKDGRPKLDASGNPLKRATARYAINTLRHFNASLLIAEGLDPKTIQRRLGHGSIQVTFDMYGHLFTKRANDAAAIARIEQKLLG